VYSIFYNDAWYFVKVGIVLLFCNDMINYWLRCKMLMIYSINHVYSYSDYLFRLRSTFS